MPRPDGLGDLRETPRSIQVGGVPTIDGLGAAPTSARSAQGFYKVWVSDVPIEAE